MNKRILHLFDKETDVGEFASERYVMLWQTLSENSQYQSLQRLVNDRSWDLRREFLAWHYEMTTKALNTWPTLSSGKDCFSTWWISRIAEKSPMRSIVPFQILKFRCLEKYYLEQCFEGIFYHGNDPLCSYVLSKWMGQISHIYQGSKPSYLWRISRRFSWIVPNLKSMGSRILRAFVHAHKLRRQRPLDTLKQQKYNMVLSYFPNADMKALKHGKFESNYWGHLFSLLREQRIAIRHIWIYYPNSEVSWSQAKQFAEHCSSVNGEESFELIEHSLSVSAVFLVFFRWLMIAVKNIVTLRQWCSIHYFDSRIDFYKILGNDLYESLFGYALLDGLLFFESFKRLAQSAHNATSVFYPWENQPWELALLFNFKTKDSAIRTIGQQNSALPPMHLRCFYDAREYSRASSLGMLLPDILAVNGKGAESLLKAQKYPADRLRVVEALRYAYLGKVFAESRSSAETRSKNGDTLLVTTGLADVDVRSQMSILKMFLERNFGARELNIVIKPHPLLSHPEALMRNFTAFNNVKLSSESLGQLLLKVSCAFVANSSATVVEILTAGVPTFVSLTDNDLNLSPLFGLSHLQFISNAEELAVALQNRMAPDLSRDFFCIDQRYPRWRRLLLENSDSI